MKTHCQLASVPGQCKSTWESRRSGSSKSHLPSGNLRASRPSPSPGGRLWSASEAAATQERGGRPVQTGTWSRWTTGGASSIGVRAWWWLGSPGGGDAGAGCPPCWLPGGGRTRPRHPGLSCRRQRREELTLVRDAALPPPPTREGGSFVCLVRFGARLRGCLGVGLRPQPGRGAGQRSSRSESGPQRRLISAARPGRAICNANSPRLPAP